MKADRALVRRLAAEPRVLIVPVALVLHAVAPHVPATVGASVCSAAAVALAARRVPPAFVAAAVAAAAATVPPARPAANLLFAAAVLAPLLRTGDPHPGPELVVALPGLAALAGALPDAPDPVPGVVVGIATLAVAAVWIRDHHGPVPVPRPSWTLAPVAAVAGWLVLAPDTWGWAGTTRLEAHTAGTGRALAVGGVAVLAATVAPLVRRTRKDGPHGDD